MISRQRKRSEETKQAILTAAGKLFSNQGYDAVSMREIAKASSCSHTTIYIYFKDKEDLLHELTMPTLQQLKLKFESIAAIHHERSAALRLKEMSLEFIRFCFSNKLMYSILFMAEGSRVDETVPRLELNKLRIHLFDIVKEQLSLSLSLEGRDDLLLRYSRIYFYMLNGIVCTYKDSKESDIQILDRLDTTFEAAFTILLEGFKINMEQGEKQNEGD